MKYFGGCDVGSTYAKCVILDENGKPKETYEVTAINNPWIRKGELVKVGAGDMNFRYIVTSITHNAINRQMNIDFELADESKL